MSNLGWDSRAGCSFVQMRSASITFREKVVFPKNYRRLLLLPIEFYLFITIVSSIIRTLEL